MHIFMCFSVLNYHSCNVFDLSCIYVVGNLFIFIFRLVVEFLITTQHKLPISFKFICFSFSLSNQYKSSIFEKLSPISQANFLLTVLHIPAQHNADDSKVVLSLKKECIFYIFSNCLQCFKFLSTFVSDFLFFHFFISIPL